MDEIPKPGPPDTPLTPQAREQAEREAQRRETEQAYQDLPELMRAFSPDLTDAEITAFFASTRSSDAYNGIETQVRRAAWLRQRLAELQARGDQAPQTVGYEVLRTGNGSFFLPVFNGDSEFQIVASGNRTLSVRHLPTGIVGTGQARFDYMTGRMIFDFFREDIEYRTVYDDGSYWADGEHIRDMHYIGVGLGKDYTETITRKTPLATYAVPLCRGEAPGTFTEPAKQYRYYFYKLSDVLVAENDKGEAISFWSEERERWMRGAPDTKIWRPKTSIVSLQTLSAYADPQREMADAQGLLTGHPSQLLISRIYPPSILLDDPRLHNPNLSVSGLEEKQAEEAKEKKQREEQRKKELLQQVEEEQARLQATHERMSQELMSDAYTQIQELTALVGEVSPYSTNEGLPLSVRNILLRWHELSRALNVQEGIVSEEQRATAREIVAKWRKVNLPLVKDYIQSVTDHKWTVRAAIEIRDGRVFLYEYGQKGTDPIDTLAIRKSGKAEIIRPAPAGGAAFFSPLPGGQRSQEPLFQLPPGQYQIARDGVYVYQVRFDTQGNVEEVVEKPVGEPIETEREKEKARTAVEEPEVPQHIFTSESGPDQSLTPDSTEHNNSSSMDALLENLRNKHNKDKPPKHKK